MCLLKGRSAGHGGAGTERGGGGGRKRVLTIRHRFGLDMAGPTGWAKSLVEKLNGNWKIDHPRILDEKRKIMEASISYSNRYICITCQLTRDVADLVSLI